MADGAKDDLLDSIFSAPINLPEVKGLGTVHAEDGENEEAIEAKVNGNSQESDEEGRHDSVASEEREQKSGGVRMMINEEVSEEKEESVAADDTNEFMRYGGAVEEEHHWGNEEPEAGNESELSEGDEPRETEYDQQSEHSEHNEASTDKIAPLRSPQHDMLIDEIRQRHVVEETHEEEERAEPTHETELKSHAQQREEFIEEDVNLNEDGASDEEDISNKQTTVTQMPYDYELESSKEERQEEAHESEHGDAEFGYEHKAEAFLDYETTHARVEESVEEPGFGLESEPDESDHESVLAKFDEQAGLKSAMEVMAQFQESGTPQPLSRTLTETSENREEQLRFNELSMDKHDEHWDTPESYVNENVIMKKKEPYAFKAEIPSPDVPQTHISVKRVDSIGSTQAGTFEQSHFPAEEISFAPGVRNLKSLFEKGDGKEPHKPLGVHPPVIQYEYDADFRDHENRRAAAEKPEAIVAPKVISKVEKADDKTIEPELTYEREEPIEELVAEEEQKSVNELLSMFGGRKQPTLRRESLPRKTPEPKPESERPVNVVSAVPSRPSSSPAAVPAATESITTPATLEMPNEQAERSTSPSRQVYTPPRSPMFGAKDQFQSVRVVKNVRQFVKLWGQSVYAPGDPHPMSPVPPTVAVPDAREMRYIRALEEQVAKPAPKARSTISIFTAVFEGNKDHVSPTPQKEPARRVEPAPQAVEPVKVEPVPQSPTLISPAQPSPVEISSIVSSHDKLEEVMIDDVPVSQRRKMFEPQVTSSRRQSLNTQTGNAGKEREGKRTGARGMRAVAEVKAVVRENEPEVIAEEIPKETEKVADSVSRDQIEKATEEISDYITHLQPVSQRRKCFETNQEPVKRNFVIAKRVEG